MEIANILLMFIGPSAIGSALSGPILTRKTYLADLLLLRLAAGGLPLLLAPPTGLLGFNHPKLHFR